MPAPNPHSEAGAEVLGISAFFLAAARWPVRLAVLDQLTTAWRVGILSNMKARLRFSRRVVVAPDAFAELVVWDVPRPVRGSSHALKYRLALVVAGECVLRYDNEAGRGDHRHVGERVEPYAFTTPERLVSDFLGDARRWLDEDRDT